VFLNHFVTGSDEIRITGGQHPNRGSNLVDNQLAMPTTNGNGDPKFALKILCC